VKEMDLQTYSTFEKLPVEIILFIWDKPVLCLEDIIYLTRTCNRFYDIYKVHRKRYKGKIPLFDITIYPLEINIFEIEVTFHTFVKY
jgi:hypothetical protein